MNAVECWIGEHLHVCDVTSVEMTYSGTGPSSWRQPRPEIVGTLDAGQVSHWWWQVRFEAVASQLEQGMRVLDLGCGQGWPAIPLARRVKEVVAVDASELAVRMLGEQVRQQSVANVHVRQADAGRLPFAAEEFDAVVAVDLMDVVPDPAAVAREMHRVVKPGGRLVSIVQNWETIIGGESERHWRSCERKDGRICYRYHAAVLEPSHTLDLMCPLRPGVKVESLGLAEGPERVTIQQVLDDLRQLQPVLEGTAQRYWAPEFTCRNVCAPFAAAGFADMKVTGLQLEMCEAYAAALLGEEANGVGCAFGAQPKALLAAMQHVDPRSSMELCVQGCR